MNLESSLLTLIYLRSNIISDEFVCKWSPIKRRSYPNIDMQSWLVEVTVISGSVDSRRSFQYLIKFQLFSSNVVFFSKLTDDIYRIECFLHIY